MAAVRIECVHLATQLLPTLLLDQVLYVCTPSLPCIFFSVSEPLLAAYMSIVGECHNCVQQLNY